MCYVHPISSDAFYNSLKASNNSAYQHPDIIHEQYRMQYLWIPYSLPLIPSHTDGGSVAEKCVCCIMSAFFGGGFAVTLVQLLYFVIGALSNLLTLSIVCYFQFFIPILLLLLSSFSFPLIHLTSSFLYHYLYFLLQSRILEGAVDAMWTSLFEQHLTMMFIPGALTGLLAGITSEFR